MNTFLFVHGAFQGGWCWDQITPALQQKGHKVVAIDLPGSGEDVTPPQDVSLKSYVKKVVSTIEKIDQPVILVGHSMSGMVISQAAEEIPEKIKKLVYVCAFVPENGQAVSDIASGGPKATLNEKDQTLTLIEEFIAEDMLNESSEEDLRLFKRNIRPQPVQPFEDKVSLTNIRFGHVPSVYIETTKDRSIPIDLQRQMYATRSFERIYTLDADHFPFYSRKKELVGCLLDIAATEK
ncbi:alpha/beta fold hydrolase [Bacillus safensis]|uniref:alpha/beta fold hydrolase n=1 Tax=Bacillus safensis TaxID=561879 RepID=UPI0009098383|nr:alpha/beta fold hydrolase [Bacillus safensis]QSJ01011.1 alpha/beta fold hydrolase [Bacillus sp. 3a]TDU09765.1 pimeloyl-ACP methyl ester carboxylesterase [Bacillus sp. BK450]APJ09928.1 alpha/beta hydrolase [Bacillus safensis]MBR0615340.1 alpha/beta fold hydrolase [Bacillus safensis]MBR0637220.1 alpha/beta fold hydrolase [Bacillus safensis]